MGRLANIQFAVTDSLSGESVQGRIGLTEALASGGPVSLSCGRGQVLCNSSGGRPTWPRLLANVQMTDNQV